MTLLDFDKLAAADPLVDVTNLVAALGKARGGARDRSGQAHDLYDAAWESHQRGWDAPILDVHDG